MFSFMIHTMDIDILEKYNGKKLYYEVNLSKLIL